MNEMKPYVSVVGQLKILLIFTGMNELYNGKLLVEWKVPHKRLLISVAGTSYFRYRHLCSSLSSSSDHNAFELCIHLATNLSCTSYYQVLICG